jgi:hypothetical protein
LLTEALFRRVSTSWDSIMIDVAFMGVVIN